MLNVYCDQNNSYEIPMTCYQDRKINEIRHVIFGLQLWEPFSALSPKLGCAPSRISSSTQLGEHPNFGLNAEEGFL